MFGASRSDMDAETSSPLTTTLLPTDLRTTDGGQPRCVNIAPNLSSCRRLGYRQMRLPSLLNDTSTTASQFIDSCGHDGLGLVLMCSLLAPVCIDKPIWPCASLCRNVSATCGLTLIDCSLLPSDDQLCIGPNSTGAPTVSYSTRPDARLHRQQRKKFGLYKGCAEVLRSISLTIVCEQN